MNKLTVTCKRGTSWNKMFEDSPTGFLKMLNYALYCLNRYPCDVAWDGDVLEFQWIADQISCMESISRPKWFKG